MAIKWAEWLNVIPICASELKKNVLFPTLGLQIDYFFPLRPLFFAVVATLLLYFLTLHLQFILLNLVIVASGDSSGGRAIRCFLGRYAL